MSLLAALIAWSLRHRAVVLVATFLFVVLGLRSAIELPIDVVPDVTSVQVQVITSAPALSPVEIEKYVSIPVERAMSGLPNVVEVRSVSKYGISVVTIVFEDDTDIYFARQRISERMTDAREAIPEGYGSPTLGPISTGLGEIFQFTLRSDTLSMMELEELLAWYIGPQLRTVPGVVEVNSFGGHNRQYQVVVEAERLQALGLSIGEVVDAVGNANASAGGGYIEHNQELFVIGSDGLIREPGELEEAVIKTTEDGTPITIGAVGDVRFGGKLRRGAATINGEQEAVVGVALMLMGANSRTVTAGLKDKLAALEPTLPEGVIVEPFYDRTVLVDRTIKTVATNLIEGALLVILVLLLLLGDLKAGLVVAVTIPLSMLFAMVVMRAIGLSGNLMSLGAVDFGLIVDGAVIVVENASRRLSVARKTLGRALSDDERVETIESSTLEVRKATVFGEAIVAIVYLPILALSGMEGKLFSPMATTVLLALGGAFILSLTLVPVLISYFVRPGPEERETWILRLALAAYKPALALALRWRAAALMFAVIAFAGAAALFPRLGAVFVPQLDEGDILVEARRLPGTSLSTTVETDLRMERALLEVPEILSIVSRIGSPVLATDSMSIEQSDIYIQLKEREDWRAGLTKEDLADELSEILEEAVPEVAGSISQPIQMRTNELVAGIRSDVGVVIYGHELEVLSELGDGVVDLLRDVPGVVDLRAEQLDGLRYLRIEPDRRLLARFGLTVADVNLATETIAVGHQVGFVLEEDRRFDLVVKVDHGFAGDLAEIRRLPLRASSGEVVLLGDVANVRFENGPALVNRDKQSRRMVVEFNVRGRDLVSTVDEAQAALRALPVPTGYRLEYGGTFEHYIDARERLLVVVPIALALILFLLWTALNRVRSALLIFLNVPFAVIGGVFALWIRGLPFSISAGIGFIALFGVAVLNGLVMITFCQEIQRRGASPLDAVREAAELRLRPVLMTALTTALGFMPMAFSTAPGSEVQRPLATVVLGGLISATLLTLLVLPAVYAAFGPDERTSSAK